MSDAFRNETPQLSALMRAIRVLIAPAGATSAAARRTKSRLLATFLCVLFVVFGMVDVVGVLFVPGHVPPWYGYVCLTVAWLLNRGDHYNEHTTLWIPSTACVRYMLRFLSMRILGESQWSTGHHVVRHAWLVEADKPSTLATETDDPWLQTLLGGKAPGWSNEYLKPQLDHARFTARPQSRITATPVPATAPIRSDAPDTYADERALLATGTPAWRLL